MNYYPLKKHFYFIFLFVKLRFFSSCCGQEYNCSDEDDCRIPARNPCMIPCFLEFGYECIKLNNCGPGVCRYVCNNVVCPMGTFCYSEFTSDCPANSCNPVAVCKNPCDNYTCPDGQKCYADNKNCENSYNCPVAKCANPCEITTCGPYSKCVVKDDEATCQNPCNFKKCCAEEHEVCCAQYDGEAICKKISPPPCEDPKY